jgi:hypothetical protein
MYLIDCVLHKWNSTFDSLEGFTVGGSTSPSLTAPASYQGTDVSHGPTV